MQPIYLRNKYSHLDFLMDFKKTIVYFQTRKETMEAVSYLEGLARTVDAEDSKHSSLVSKIAAYHAIFSEQYKEEIMEAFRKGDILLLLATEAAGMGCDIGDVARVVQFKCPMDISCLVQHLGRAARNPQLQGIGILFAERRSPGMAYPDQYLDQYITTRECRRKVLNGLYHNEHQPNRNCCDLCHPEPKPQQPQQTVTFKEVHAGHIAKPRLQVRTAAQKQLAKAALLEWRAAAHMWDMAPRCDYSTEDCIMNNDVVAKLSEKFAGIVNVEAIGSAVSWRPWRREHLVEVADILIKINQKLGDGVPTNIQLPPQATQFFVNQYTANASQQSSAVRPSTSIPRGRFSFKIKTPVDMKKSRK